MLVVVARSQDQAAQALTARWAPHRAALLSCEDLSTAGWRYPLGAPEASTAVVGGRVVPVDEIAGVLTRLPAVTPQDLGHIVPEDRDYVAAEMTAFLVAWLAALRCPVLNRPTPGFLMGPSWRHEQWVRTAARLDIPVQPVRRSSGPAADTAAEHAAVSPATVTVVGTRCFGPVDARLMVQAQRLADAAEVDLLAVHFSGPEAGAAFLAADLWPDVTAPDVAEAILAYLIRGETC